MNDRGRHPTALELSEWLDGNASDRVGRHIEACAVCRHHVAGAAPAGPAEPSSVPADFNVSVPDRLVEKFTRSDQPGPEQGQVRRLRWDDQTALAVLWSVGGTDCTVMPTSVDTHLADDRTLIVPAERSPVGVEVGVWTDVDQEVPLAVLERYLGEFDRQVIDTVEALREGTGAGSLPEGLGVGVRPGSALDDRAQYRGVLRAALEELASAGAWEPADAADGDLPAVLARLGLDLEVLQAELGLDTREALDLLRGDRRASSEELERLDELAAEAGVTPAPSAAAGPPLDDELVEELNQPARKLRVVAEAGRRELPETRTREELAYEAQQLALAARRDRREVNWGHFLDQVLVS